jgi:hypothetical protein
MKKVAKRRFTWSEMASDLLDPSTELWLVQAPAGMDLQALHGRVVKAGSASDGQMRMESSAGSFAWVDLEQQVANSVCLLPDGQHAGPSRADAGQRFKATATFARKVVLYCTDEVHSAALSAHTAPSKPRVAQPKGMRVRFRPLGDTAQPSAMPATAERSKKRRKDKSAVEIQTPGSAARAESGERTEKKSDKKEKQSKKDRKRDRGEEDTSERKRHKEHKQHKQRNL